MLFTVVYKSEISSRRKSVKIIAEDFEQLRKKISYFNNGEVLYVIWIPEDSSELERGKKDEDT